MPTHNELRELVRQFDEACDSLARHSLLRETAQETIDYWERRKSTLLLELESLLNQAPAEGWVVVPREPTREMLKAADAVDNAAYCGGSMHGADLEDLWHAMLAAAPAAQVAEAPDWRYAVVSALEHLQVRDEEQARSTLASALALADGGDVPSHYERRMRHYEPKAAPAVEVDEAMVERFRAAYEKGPIQRSESRRVHYALTAALGREGGGNG